MFSSLIFQEVPCHWDHQTDFMPTHVCTYICLYLVKTSFKTAVTLVIKCTYLKENVRLPSCVDGS